MSLPLTCFSDYQYLTRRKIIDVYYRWGHFVVNYQSCVLLSGDGAIEIENNLHNDTLHFIDLFISIYFVFVYRFGNFVLILTRSIKVDKKRVSECFFVICNITLLFFITSQE